MAKIKRKKPTKIQLISWLAVVLICFSAGTAYGRYLQKTEQAAMAIISPPAQEQEQPAPEPAPIEEAKEQSPALLVVDIKGAVEQPGIYRLQEGSRVADAAALATLKEDANTDMINMALPISDGMEIIIPYRAEGEETDWQALAQANTAANTAAATTDEKPAANSNKPVNINTATEAQLQTLTGIGPAKARAIIEYRQQKGNFARIEDIKKVSGIGDATYNNIKDNITVE